MKMAVRNEELSSPLAPNTKCRALHSFVAERSDDLGFVTGEILTIIEPSPVLYWYKARNDRGAVGIIPITFVEAISSPHPPPPLPSRPSKFLRSPLHQEGPLFLLSSSAPPSNSLPKQQSLPRTTPTPPTSPSKLETNRPLDPIDTRPPMPLPPQPRPKSNVIPLRDNNYPTIQAFYANSGWFKPTVDMVLANKLGFSLHAFRRSQNFIFYFQHKYDAKLHYVGKTYQLYDHLTRLFSRLYDKPQKLLSPLEEALRFECSDADKWNVRAWSCTMDVLDLELAKTIVKMRSLRPCGLNRELIVLGDCYEPFCQWFTEYRKQQKK